MNRRYFAERFTTWVSPPNNGGCWLWMGAQLADGYGATREQGVTYRAHRYVYENLVGPIPRGFVLDHVCDVRLCVNPDHLRIVTQGANLQAGYDRRNGIGKCNRGHEFDYTYTRPDGRKTRVCRQCRRNRRTTGS